MKGILFRLLRVLLFPIAVLLIPLDISCLAVEWVIKGKTREYPWFIMLIFNEKT